MQYRLFILFSVFVSLVLLASPVTAQDTADVPTWAVGYRWSYTETGTYTVAGRADVSLNENSTWEVNEVTSDTYVLRKTGTLTGTLVVRVDPIRINAEIRNGQTSGRMVVRRSNLGVIEETQTRTGELFSGAFRLGTVALEFTLRDAPTIKTYNFPLYDGGGFFANVTKTVTYRLTGTVFGIDLPTLSPPGTYPLALALTSTTTAQDQNYQVVATADQYDASISEVYDPSIKSYRQEVWNIPVPALSFHQVRNLTGTPTVPDTPAQLTITGADSGSQFVSTGETVTLAGTGWPANSTVVIRQPETMGVQWSAMTDANGAFSTMMTVPDTFRDTVISDFVANVGLVAESGSNAAAVATLVVVE